MDGSRASGFIVVLCILPALLPAADNCVTANGALRVEGTALVNQRGEPIQLRGMSSHGLHWYHEYTCNSAILETKKRGANLFRLAMYADSVNGGYCQNRKASEHNTRLLHQGIKNALAADMYVIVDWHLLEDENPLKTMDKAVGFFEDISARYGDHPAIIYEICNEPSGDTTWEDIRTYAETVIPVIRRHAPNAVVLVGTPDNSSNLLAVLDHPLNISNIMYTYHLYTGYANYDFAYKLDTMRARGLPVFVSEWGVSVNQDTGEVDMAQGRAFLDYMRRHRVSWANWSLSNKDEHFSALHPHVSKLSAWTDEDLTPSGQLVFTAFSE